MKKVSRYLYRSELKNWMWTPPKPRGWTVAKLLAVSLFFLFAGCASRFNESDQLVSVQVLDRNGFSETFSGLDRLKNFEKSNFLAPQPYQKVIRVYGKSSKGKTSFKINTYHLNGHPKQYLEVENGRAHGKFFEWHPNGQLKIDAVVIEGTPDLSEMAQMTWVFDQTSFVYNEMGNLIGKIGYEKGFLQGPSLYFYPNGTIFKEVPYDKDKIEGDVEIFDPSGYCVEKIGYINGEKEGTAIAYWKPDQLKYNEEYRKGALMEAKYFNPLGEIVGKIDQGSGVQAVFEDGFLLSLIDYQSGFIKGRVQNFDHEGNLISLFHIDNNMKHGDEWEYYPPKEGALQPKLYLQWHEDTIQGIVKTWHKNGVIESQREIRDNKKHGLSFAWSNEEELLLVEEYENDRLIKGSYFKKGEKNPISKVENGKGVVTFFDEQGRALKKVIYEKGEPTNGY